MVSYFCALDAGSTRGAGFDPAPVLTQLPLVADESDRVRNGSLPIVGNLLRRQRREAERALHGLVDTVVRDGKSLERLVRRINMDAIIARLDINGIVARIDLDAFLARLDINTIVQRLDVDAMLARLDMQAIVDRLDVDAMLARLDMDAIVARVDLDALLARLDPAALDALAARVDLAKRENRPQDL